MIRNKILGFAALLLTLGGMTLTSCSDDDTVKSPLDQPAVTTGAFTPTTAVFSWTAVADATQYGYTLTDPEGEVVAADVTNKKVIELSGLTPDTEYVLKVWAYAPALSSDKTESPVATVTFTTPAQTKLAQPVLNVAQGGGKITVSWPDNADADYYEYSYTTSSGEEVEGTTVHPRLTVASPEADATYTFKVKASSDSDWYGASQEGTANITCAAVTDGTKFKVDAVTADYPDSPWNATVVYCSDSTYSIRSWYLADGYDIDFTADADGNITLINYPEVDGYLYLPMDDASYGKINNVEGKVARTGGRLSFDDPENGHFDFTWGKVPN